MDYESEPINYNAKTPKRDKGVSDRSSLVYFLRLIGEKDTYIITSALSLRLRFGTPPPLAIPSPEQRPDSKRSVPCRLLRHTPVLHFRRSMHDPVCTLPIGLERLGASFGNVSKPKFYANATRRCS